jgi:hypothetical protein
VHACKITVVMAVVRSSSARLACWGGAWLVACCHQKRSSDESVLGQRSRARESKCKSFQNIEIDSVLHYYLSSLTRNKIDHTPLFALDHGLVTAVEILTTSTAKRVLGVLIKIS